MYDVLVVGGGVMGLSAAIAMKQRGYHVALCDSGDIDETSLGDSMRVYAINQASVALFKALDIWGKTHTSAPYRNMSIWDAKSKGAIDFDARMQAQDALGFIVSESDLKRALILKAKAIEVCLHAGTEVNTCTEHPESMEVEGLRAKHVIIADGANSKTRELLKVPMVTKPYEQDALVATIEVEKPHKQTAFQVFHPKGPLAFLPLANPHHCSIVWSYPAKDIQQLKAMPEEKFSEELERTFSSKLGTTKLLSKRISFPLYMRHVQQYVGRRWLVMGDAAHTIHPLAGLGLNLGLADLVAWLNIVDEQGPKAWQPRYMQAYQRARKYEVSAVIALMQGIKSTFATDTSLFAVLRGTGIGAINKLPPLKRAMMRFASGIE